METLEFVEKQWALIVQAPFVFLTAVVLIFGAIWAFLSLLFKQELATKNATIEHLRERLEYKAAVASEPVASTRVIDTTSTGNGTFHHGPAEVAKPAPPVPKVDPDAIYQRDRIVGKVIAPRAFPAESRMTFEAITDTADLDRGKPFQYRDVTLALVSVEQSIGMKIVSGGSGSRTLQNVIEGVVCRIVG